MLLCVCRGLTCGLTTLVPFLIHRWLIYTLQKEAKAFLSARLKWFPPHRHGTSAMQRLGAGIENILKNLLGFFLPST